MSSIWKETATGGWEEVALCSGLAQVEPLPASVQLLSVGQAAQRRTMILAAPGTSIRVNGQVLAGGFRVLEHRDEIQLGRTRVIFSAESRPVPVRRPLPAGERAPVCPVCRGPIRDGEQAVECPGCGRWFHQIDAGEGQRAKYCWTYAETCRFCGHHTSLAGAAWRPEMEEAHAV